VKELTQVNVAEAGVEKAKDAKAVMQLSGKTCGSANNRICQMRCAMAQNEIRQA